MSARILRATVLAGLAAFVLLTHSFVSIDSIRIKVVEEPRAATDGLVRVSTTGFPQADDLLEPFALIARVNVPSAGTSRLVVAVDGAPACERSVTGGGSRRIDCAVTQRWQPGIEHTVTLQGPSSWTLEYLELATHHGNTSGAHYLVILPRGSDRYVRPGIGWVAATWLIVATILVVPASRSPRWIQISHRVLAVPILFVMAASVCSQWLSNYRVVISAETIAIWLALLLIPQEWAAVRWFVEAEQRSRRRWFAYSLAAFATGIVIAVALLNGAFVAGGSDVYGYVSQAHLWATGNLHIEQPFVRDMKWPSAAEALAPLGYSPAPEGTSIVPIYSPGFPMVMGLFERLGGREAVFYVVPLLGGLTVWATFLMGARLAGPGVGASAAILMATSPPFLLQLVLPMSDIPVTAWWALALALALSESRMTVLVAGLAAGAAILTRPNLIPLAVIPGGLLLWRAVRERDVAGHAVQRFCLFAAGALAGCVGVAIVNTRTFGSPLTSGYGRPESLFLLSNLLPNLARYPYWLLQTGTPAILLAFLAPFVVKRASRGASAFEPRAVVITWGCFIAAVLLSYVFFRQFDDWIWLRYVLPAFPPLFVLVSAALGGLLARVEPVARALLIATIVGALAWRGATFDRNFLELRKGEQRIVAMADYIAKNLPEQAAIVSMHHSGSVRYYSGRLTVRYDYIPPELLDAVLEDLRRLGYQPYIVLEDWEETGFRARFEGHSALAALDWKPIARIGQPATVTLYHPAARQAP